MAILSGVAPVLSTPEQNLLEDRERVKFLAHSSSLSPEELHNVYEIERTIQEIQKGQWKRIALQFPDDMLADAPSVLATLDSGLRAKEKAPLAKPEENVLDQSSYGSPVLNHQIHSADRERRLYILADTSYGACCVDEIAAEHVDADVVVHYGRACLSPTARLPTIHVFTNRTIPVAPAEEVFKNNFPDQAAKVILMADVMYNSMLSVLEEHLRTAGYTGVYATSIIHDPSSPLPNRTLPEEAQKGITELSSYHLFHISQPPTSLLLTLASRLASIYILPTDITAAKNPSVSVEASSLSLLRRRYALITSLSTASIFGILINTLSVKNYLHMVEHVKSQITAAGKKSYTFVMGKVNAAKLANFSEVGGWVVIGCWESSLIESKDFWKPVITPFELSLALQRDTERLWTGQWRSNFNDILRMSESQTEGGLATAGPGDRDRDVSSDSHNQDFDSESESAAPEFDLRSGRYVPHSRLMQDLSVSGENGGLPGSSGTLVARSNGHLASIGGQVSPGAEHLRSKRTWKGLGSDLEIGYDQDGSGAPMEQGRSGIARGYHSAGAAVRR